MSAKRKGLSAGGKDLLIMGAVLIVMWIIGMSVESAHGQEIPKRTFDAKYWTATVVTAGLVYADAYSTANHEQIYCSYEIKNPWLYGRQPTTARSFGVMSAELGSAMIGSYLLKKHQSKLWIVPLGFIAFNHGEGVVHNVRQGCF